MINTSKFLVISYFIFIFRAKRINLIGVWINHDKLASHWGKEITNEIFGEYTFKVKNIFNIIGFD